MLKSLINRGKGRDKIGALFDSPIGAMRAVGELSDKMGISAEQVRIINPYIPHWERQPENSKKRFKDMLIQAHVTMGAAGLTFGLWAAVLLMFVGNPSVASDPLYTIGIFGAGGLFIGLLAAGLFVMYPNQAVNIGSRREPIRNGHSMVLVRTYSKDEEMEAKNILHRISRREIKKF